MYHTYILFFIVLLTSNITLAAPYKLTHPAYSAGFFSVFHTVLGALNFYETTPACTGLSVDFKQDGLYYDPERGQNWWEYYFEPIKLGTTQGKTVQEFKNKRKADLSFSAQFSMSRERGNALIKKYMHVKPAIQQKVTAFMQKHFGSSTIVGVHYRGTDKVSEAPALSYSAVSSRLRRDLSREKNIKIFVATDDEKFLRFMHKEFPGTIISTTAIRSQNGKPVHYSSQGSPYQRGEDALIDCLLLAECKVLYKMASNLSDASAKFNASMPVIRLNKSYWVQEKFKKLLDLYRAGIEG